MVNFKTIAYIGLTVVILWFIFQPQFDQKMIERTALILFTTFVLFVGVFVVYRKTRDIEVPKY